jgi:hypothetical protein
MMSWFRRDAVRFRRAWPVVAILLSSGLHGARGQDLTPGTFVQQAAVEAAAPTVALNAPTPPAAMDVSARIEFNSNPTLKEGGDNNDVIFEERFGFSRAWRLSDSSFLTLDAQVGYQTYINHTYLDGLTLNLGGDQGLNLSFTTGPVYWNAYDRPSYTEDPSQSPELSNVGKYEAFTNAAGVDAFLPVSTAVGILMGYQRLDYFTIETSASSLSQNRTSDMVSLATPVKINAATTVGLAGSVTVTQYHEGNGFSSVAYSAGPFVRAQLTSVTTAYVIGGLETIDSDDGGGTGGEFFAEARLTNQCNSRCSEEFDAGRIAQLGVLSDFLTLDYVRYSEELNLGTYLKLTGNLFLNHGREMGGVVGETFWQYGGGLGLEMPLANDIDLSLGCQWVDKNSNESGRSYRQSLATSAIDWTF